jgi:hypothetical protein
MAWPHVFASESGSVAASQLDDNFNAAAFAADLTTTNTNVAALPSNATPLAPTAGGAHGSSAALSRDDHQHPPQSAAPSIIAGTTYTMQQADDGLVKETTNGSAVTVTMPNSLTVGTSGVLTQAAAGQVTFAAAVGATLRQRSSLTKTSGQWAEVSWYVRTNSGGAAAEYVLAGDMA